MIKSIAVAVALSLAAGGAAWAHDPPASAAAGAEQMTPEAAPAAAVVDAFHNALRRGDTQGALALLAEDALVYEEGGAERSRAEYASHHLAADAAFAAAMTSTRSRRVGRNVGDIAWIASESRTTGRFRDRAVDRLGAETMILRRQAGVWRIVHIHWSSRAPAAPPAT